MAEEATLRGVADSKPRRSLARSKRLECADVTKGGSALLNKPVGRESSPAWRGPAVVLGPDEAGVSVEFQGRRRRRVAEACRHGVTVDVVSVGRSK